MTKIVTLSDIVKKPTSYKLDLTMDKLGEEIQFTPEFFILDIKQKEKFVDRKPTGEIESYILEVVDTVYLKELLKSTPIEVVKGLISSQVSVKVTVPFEGNSLLQNYMNIVEDELLICNFENFAVSTYSRAVSEKYSELLTSVRATKANVKVYGAGVEQ